LILFLLFLHLGKISNMKGKYLGEFEEVVLLTVGVLFDKAYGISIRQEIEDQLDRKVGLGALHATLVRLEGKGFLDSRYGEATQKRGGKRKRLFQVTAKGQNALIETRHSREKLWKAIPKSAFNLGY